MTYVESEEKGWYDSEEGAECVGCHNRLHGTVCMEDRSVARPPQYMDCTVCAHCGQIMVFGEDLVPREPTIAELLLLQENPAWGPLERASQMVKNNPCPVPPP